MKILLVEDHIEVAQSTVMLLGILGYEVTHVENGTKAVEAAKGESFDLALVDIGLPDVTGYDVAASLRAIAGVGIVLVALTGYDCEEKIKQSAFDHYFKKPMDYKVLPSLLPAAV